MTTQEHAKSLGDTSSPTDKLRSDSSGLPAPASGQQEHIKPASTDVTAHGFPNTQVQPEDPLFKLADEYVARVKAREHRESSPRWESSRGYEDTDEVFKLLNAVPAVPGKLNESEQKIADRLTSVIEATCKQEREKGESLLPPEVNKDAHAQMTDMISKMDGRIITKILPTVNDQLAHSDLNPPVKLASVSYLSKFEYRSNTDVLLGVKTPESGQDYVVDCQVGIAQESTSLERLLRRIMP